MSVPPAAVYEINMDFPSMPFSVDAESVCIFGFRVMMHEIVGEISIIN